MALITQLKTTRVKTVTAAKISLTSNNGRHVLTDGSSVDVLTDERFKGKDEVLMIQDNKGINYIFAGKK